MEDNARSSEIQSIEFQSDTLGVALMFEQLSPKAQTALIEILRQLSADN